MTKPLDACVVGTVVTHHSGKDINCAQLRGIYPIVSGIPPHPISYKDDVLQASLLKTELTGGHECAG